MKSGLCGKRGTLAAVLFAVLCITMPAAAQMKMDVMQKWMTVTVVHYAVVGEYSADTLIVNAGTSGYAEVKDRVEINFDWDQTEAKLVGEPTFKNFASEMGALRNGAEGCQVPTLDGPYEHFTLQSVKQGMSAQLALTAQRNYPAAGMPRDCTGGPESVPAKSEELNEELTVPGTMILAMEMEAGGNPTISPDGNSLIFTDKGWTWTYTLTPVK